jgi:hypothetical protein
VEVWRLLSLRLLLLLLLLLLPRLDLRRRLQSQWRLHLMSLSGPRR